MTWEIRPAVSADVSALVPMLHDFAAGEGIPWAGPRVIMGLHALLASPELGFVLVAQGGSSLVGYGIVTYNYDLEFAGRDAYVTDLFVATEVRGQGLGTALLRALEDHARRHDVQALHLQVRYDNEAARLYRRAGYVVVPRTTMTKDLRGAGVLPSSAAES
jgi:ribosomal protein S18 acetylase RimI-like enzyme